MKERGTEREINRERERQRERESERERDREREREMKREKKKERELHRCIFLEGTIFFFGFHKKKESIEFFLLKLIKLELSYKRNWY